MKDWMIAGLCAAVVIGSVATVDHFYHHPSSPISTRNSPATASSIIPLWDFTVGGTGAEERSTGEPVVPADIRRKIDAAVARQNPSSDELLITSVAEGVFSEGSGKQKVYTTWQFGHSMAEHVSFFAIFTDGHLSLTQDEYNGVILRTVRLPGADVD
jgi:hypothetical protein